MKKHITILTPCYNEEENVEAMYEKVKSVFVDLPQYTYEHLFIDNCSRDRTPQILRELAAKDRNVKVILNARNFGHIRSPMHGLLQSTGDATIGLVCDFQDPPELIVEFLKKWEEGYKIVLGVKSSSDESLLFFTIRWLYYKFVRRLSDVDLVINATGFGLVDRRVVDVLRQIDDPYPYFRGLIADIGFESAKIPYKQPARRRGITKNNFYTLYDLAMLGITNHSKVPLRIATMTGFVLSAGSLFLAFAYFIAKLVWWDYFDLGMAPILISFFFVSSVQLFFIGILGEYIGAIHTQVQKRPLVIERERLNFDAPPAPPSNGAALSHETPGTLAR